MRYLKTVVKAAHKRMMRHQHAVRINSAELLGKLKEYSQKMSEEVQAKDQKLRSTGYRNYKK